MIVMMVMMVVMVVMVIMVIMMVMNHDDLAIVAVKNLTVSHHQVDQTCETSKSRLDTFATAS